MKSFILGIAAGALLASPALAASGKNSRHESIVQVTGNHKRVGLGGCSSGSELFATVLHGKEAGQEMTSAVRLCTKRGLSAAERTAELLRFRGKLAGDGGMKGEHGAEILRRVDLRLAELRQER
jgi:hypothetical protein